MEILKTRLDNDNKDGYNRVTNINSDNNCLFGRRFEMKIKNDVLNLALAELCISKKELAEKSGVDVVTISRMISGVQEPRPKTVGKIAKAINVSVKELIED